MASTLRETLMAPTSFDLPPMCSLDSVLELPPLLSLRVSLVEFTPRPLMSVPIWSERLRWTFQRTIHETPLSSLIMLETTSEMWLEWVLISLNLL